MTRLIALLTDFGLRDPYAGIMKGVILGINPKAEIVDLCHDLAPQDRRGAAFALRSAAPFFPAGALFVAVVDPGVGGTRRILWGRTEKAQFLFPDNGLIGWLHAGFPLKEVREVSNRKLFLPDVGATFHGRDIFAPVAARLSLGLPPSSLGPRAPHWERLPFPGLRRVGARARGEILVVDRFGNAVTNLSPADAEGRTLRFAGRSLGPLRRCYGDVVAGRPLALVGSAGLVELSVNGASFAARFRARAGDAVEAA